MSTDILNCNQISANFLHPWERTFGFGWILTIRFTEFSIYLLFRICSPQYVDLLVCKLNKYKIVKKVTESVCVPVFLIKCAVLNRLQYMVSTNNIGRIKVCNGTAYLKHPVISTGRQSQLVKSITENLLCLIVSHAHSSEQIGSNACIAVNSCGSSIANS